jgi:hypothetical protein
LSLAAGHLGNRRGTGTISRGIADFSIDPASVHR